MVAYNTSSKDQLLHKTIDYIYQTYSKQRIMVRDAAIPIW